MGMAATVTTTPAAFVAVLVCAAVLAAHAGGHGKPEVVEANDLVAKTCANATSDICQRLFTSDFCVSALRSDNRSAVAKHPRDLALVAMDLLKLSATAADAKIDAALRAGVTKGDKVAERHLQYCRLSYDALVRTVPVCRGLVEEYKLVGENENEGSYFNCVDKLGTAAEDCRAETFTMEDEVSKAVEKEIREVSDRASLAKVMIEQMLGVEEA